MVQHHDPPLHDLRQATPEVMSLTSLLSPGYYSWHRLFISLNVLLVFLLVAFFKGGKQPVGVKAGRKKKGASTVLLVGPLASGKTALFSKLVYGHAPETHTSMKENEGTVKAKWGAEEFTGEQEKPEEKTGEEPSAIPLSTPLHLVDIPGHPRLRTRSLTQYLPAADGIVFTIDASSGLTGKNARDAGQHFHILISLLSLLSQRQSTLPPVLILLTKSDHLSSSSSSTSSTTSSPSTTTKTKSPSLTLDRAKQSLLRELERRRLASTGASSSSAGKGGAGTPLSAGAKLEGLEAIPAGASSSGGALKSFLSSLGLSSSSAGASTSAALNETSAGLPSDEGEILSNEDAFGYEQGAVEWEKLERAVGTEFVWALGNVKSKGGEGMEKVWEFVEGL